jgi:hypothetical protein
VRLVVDVRVVGLAAQASGSGVAINDDCITAFFDLKKKRKYRYIVYSILDQKSVVLEKTGAPDVRGLANAFDPAPRPNPDGSLTAERESIAPRGCVSHTATSVWSAVSLVQRRLATAGGRLAADLAGRLACAAIRRCSFALHQRRPSHIMPHVRVHAVACELNCLATLRSSSELNPGWVGSSWHAGVVRGVLRAIPPH